MISIKGNKVSNCGVGVSLPENCEIQIDMADNEFIHTGKVVEIRSKVQDILELLSEEHIHQIKEYIDTKCNEEIKNITDDKFEKMQQSNDKQFKANLFFQILQTAPIAIDFVNKILQSLK